MSALKQSLPRAGVSLALLVSAIAAMLAISGVAASSAFAECTKGTLTGKGSTLQNEAQNKIWIPHFCSADSAETYTPAYDGGGSGSGLKEWKFIEKGTINHEYEFIGTDAAPTEAQIKTAREGAGSANVVVVPVAQTAIAIIANMPSECVFKSGKGIQGINNKDLEKVFSGAIQLWSEIANTEEKTAGKCKQTITRVVRKEGSGTTLQFKNYLSKINSKEPCAKSPTEWAKLEEIGTKEEPNINWPECGAMKPETAVGGGELAKKVKETSGTIGYAALPDAKAKHATTIPVEDEQSAGVPSKWVAPGIEESEDKDGTTTGVANCAKQVYNVPSGAEEGEKVNLDWSKTFGGNPQIGGGGYPICTLTYILAWDNYETAGFSEAEATGGGVSDYVGSIVNEATLNSVKLFYSPLPTGTAGHNVETAAIFASEAVAGAKTIQTTPGGPSLQIPVNQTATVDIQNPSNTAHLIVSGINLDGAGTYDLNVGTCIKTYVPMSICRVQIERTTAGVGTLTIHIVGRPTQAIQLN